MPRSNRPATTGYERLAQADQLSDAGDSDDEYDPLAYSSASLQPPQAPRYAPITQPRPHSGMTSPKASYSGRPNNNGRQNSRRRVRRNSGVDLKAINARLERWADEIASKFKRGKAKKTGDEDERLEIIHSVFQPPEGIRPVTAEFLSRPEPGYMTKAEFEAIVDSVRRAIEQGVHPLMISQGSSGSYFARNPEGKVVGVFKPKDEEPYAAGNPKWNKWIHRNLFPCCFGRACLIPNLSYVSEAAAYVLDVQLRTHLVPYTDVVYLSSKSFHYPFWDRYNYSRKKKPLPAKPGSFQVFLEGFKDANVFLREHPWPDQYLSGFRTSDPHRKRKKRWADNCRPSSAPLTDDDAESDDGHEDGLQSLTPGPGNFVWTESLKQQFREELEKLVILDYIMRNTDRGLDNWMIKVDWETQDVSIASEPAQFNMDAISGGDEEGPRPVDLTQREARTRASYPYRTQKPMDASAPPAKLPGGRPEPKISIGAIDNSLSWPWKHPDAWRSFPFGWLFLPVDLIGRPFSQKTRNHFLPLLTSTAWWSQTQLALRKVFQIDPDFQERMFARQMAVMKGQAWNVVETLKTPDHGPLELTRRAKVCVWDDLVDVPVAVPMRVTSSEMRRRAEENVVREEAEEEEMDIAHSAPTNTNAVADVLGSSSPRHHQGAAELPNPGRFELSPSVQGVGVGVGVGGDGNGNGNDLSGSQPSLLNLNGNQESGKGGGVGGGGGGGRGGGGGGGGGRPGLPKSMSSTGPPRKLNAYSPERHREHQRRFSFATAQGRRESNSIASQLYAPAGRLSLEHNYPGGGGGFGGEDDDELDGDLGYAAAEGMEGNQRKVIVERLEPVKSRNPVFTWC
ncbi:phosphatidylinositol 3 and 4-kinase-domain-containing protein [Diplogelasinospora grovesii]|uniref:Phosphatidylinositol 4-kinase n=1 Tax=Diplogelasinospora grovesii TaxID=303347 RepID=A0AAN6N7N0_9PEZI|nr:phosphatidylinositol 3 and 4-kinase-domain-containing protein [Diplogelasinospora grovesii]